MFSLVKYYKKRRLNKILSLVDTCSTFFGMPGSGKTSFCSYIVDLCCASGVKVYSNVPIKGAIEFSKSDFGAYDFSNAVIIIDEGSLFYDGRNFQNNFNQQSLEYLKLLRHRHNHVFIFSQSLDIDIKFIRMSHNIFQLWRTPILNMFTTVSCVRRKVDVDENTHKFEDFYYKSKGLLGIFHNLHFLRFPTYKRFDSYEAPELPKMVEKIYR